MNELMKTHSQSVRDSLLTTVCGLAFLISFAGSSIARAEDSERPTVWIELGGQFDSMSNSQETFIPSFLDEFDHLNFEPVLPGQRSLQYAFGGEGKLSFQPRGSDWIFSASVRYGRSNGQKTSNQQQAPQTWKWKSAFPPRPLITVVQKALYNIEANARKSETHAILDFQVGKDVGLGLFSAKQESVISIGVRFAQFTSRTSASISGIPSFFHSGTDAKYHATYGHSRKVGSTDSERSFHGVGPSVAWDGSIPVLRQDEDSEIRVDWGVNAAALFGRQKVQGQTDVAGYYYKTGGHILPTLVVHRGLTASYHRHTPFTRTRSVIAPNLGGFAGVSLKFPNAKVSLGYRADFFFGAMDGGIETHKSYDRNFYGPFATISIGLGG